MERNRKTLTGIKTRREFLYQFRPPGVVRFPSQESLWALRRGETGGRYFLFQAPIIGGLVKWTLNAVVVFVEKEHGLQVSKIGALI